MSIQASVNSAIEQGNRAALIGSYIAGQEKNRQEEIKQVERAADVASRDEQDAINKLQPEYDTYDKISKQIKDLTSAPGADVAGPEDLDKMANLINELKKQEDLINSMEQVGLRALGGQSDIYKQAYVKTGKDEYMGRVEQNRRRADIYEENLLNSGKDVAQYRANFDAYNALVNKVAEEENKKNRVEARAHILYTGQKALEGDKEAIDKYDRYNQLLITKRGGKK